MVGVNHKEAKKRLQQVIVDSKSKSLRAFALSINIDPSLLAKIIGDQRTLTPAIVKAITERYKVNEDWLLYGEGEKYGQNGTRTPAQHPSDPLTGAHVTLQDHINLLKDYNEKLFALLSSNLGNLQEGQRIMIAYQKAWVDHAAELESGGDPDKKEEIKYRFGKHVDDILHPGPLSGIQSGSGKQRKV